MRRLNKQVSRTGSVLFIARILFPLVLVAATVFIAAQKKVTSKASGESHTITVTNSKEASNNLAAPPAPGAYKWNGSISTDWQIAANWTPIRVIPDPGDTLTFDGSVTPSPLVTNVPTQTIATLSVVNNIAVTVNASTLGAQTLTIAGTTGSDLSVSGGSSLTLAGTNALTISLSSGSKATIGGQIIFQNASHRLLGANGQFIPAAIKFQAGSIFTTPATFSGNPFRTLTSSSA